MKNERRAIGRIAAVVATILLAACAETKTGGNGTGIRPAPEPFVASGTLVGVEPFSLGTTPFETGTTAFRQDEAAGAGSAGLRLGMSFAATGTVNGKDAAPVLQEAGTQSAASGPVGTIDAARQRFTIATLTFVVDVNTLYDGVAGFPALAPGVYVEVSGMPLADLRTLLATRVTRIAAPADGRISIAGRIEAVSAQGVSVAGLTGPVNPGASVALGTRARLIGSFDAQASALANGQVAILTDYAPAATTRVELEGIALDGAPAGGAFRLRTPARDYDVAPGMTTVPVTAGSRVRLIATAASGTSLVPESVALVSSEPMTYRVTGTVSEFASLAALRVRGEPVDLTTAVIRGGSASDIANGRRLAIVGIAGPGALRVSEATIVPSEMGRAQDHNLPRHPTHRRSQ